MNIRKRLFGGSGQSVTQVGLGGEGILRTYDRTAEAVAVITEAFEMGIDYFDSANAYAGSESYYGRFWQEHPDIRADIFQTSKSSNRDCKGANADLINSLSTMHLEYLDLWQIHDVRTSEDLKAIERPGGALDAFVDAKMTGKVRFIGVTGHHDPTILEHAVANWPVDAVLLPTNPLEAAIGGFMDIVMERAEERGIAVIGMKVLGASHYISRSSGITPELLLRYGLSQNIDTAIVGCSSPQEVRTLARAGRDFKPMSEEEQGHLVNLFRPYARKLAFYRGLI